MSTVVGIVETITGPNKGGYYSFKIGDTWHGAGKSPPKFGKGQKVKFETFLKDGKYSTVDGEVQISKDTPSPAATQEKKPSWTPRPAPIPSVRDAYWENKDKHDKEVVAPRITYQGSLERAIEIFKIIDAKGGYPALAKVKPVDLQGAVRALIDDETDRIFKLSAVAKFPEKSVGEQLSDLEVPGQLEVDTKQKEEKKAEPEQEEEWS